MLDMGFAEDLEAILAATPSERQTALFSATLPPRIVTIASKHLKNPVRIAIARRDDGRGEDAEGAPDGLHRRARPQAGGARARAGPRVADGGPRVLPDAARSGRSDGEPEGSGPARRGPPRRDFAGGARSRDEEAARRNARARRRDGRGGAGPRHRAPLARRELRRALPPPTTTSTGSAARGARGAKASPSRSPSRASTGS